MENAGRNQVQYCLLPVDNQGMSGIVTALKPDHSPDSLRQQIDDLTLAFVSPLGADNDYVFTHLYFLDLPLPAFKLYFPITADFLWAPRLAGQVTNDDFTLLP